MSSHYSYDSNEENETIYNSYMEMRLCFVCIKACTAFVDINATDSSNTTVVDKLKFLCRENENYMFPPSNVPLNICYKCDCNISFLYNAKLNLVGAINFWERFFNLTHHPSPSDDYNFYSKILTDDPKYTYNQGTTAQTATATATATVTTATITSTNPGLSTPPEYENIYIKEESVSYQDSNDIVNNLKGFLNFKNKPETIVSEEQIEINTEPYTYESYTFEPMPSTSSYGNLIPVNIISDCTTDPMTTTPPPLNILNTGLVPDEDTDNKFGNASTASGRKTIFNQVDPSLFIKDAVNNIFLCLKCNRQFAELRYLSRHLKLHCDDETGGLFTCPQCNRKFLTESYLEKHMQCHQTDAPFKCENCSMTFATEQLLRRHTDCHSKVKKYFCDVCKRGYRMRHELTTHMEVHAGKMHPCKLCTKTFTTKRLLDSHMKRHKTTTTTTKQYKCEVCGDGFRGHASLKAHLDTHTDDIKFNCPHCEKFYYNQTQLKVHLCKHNNDRRFICNICGKKFFTAQILENHGHSHTDSQNFVCEFCGKSYDIKSALYIHAREHAPYKCRRCQKGFWKTRNLAAHYNRIHGGITDEDSEDHSPSSDEIESDNNNADSNITTTYGYDDYDDDEDEIDDGGNYSGGIPTVVADGNNDEKVCLDDDGDVLMDETEMILE